MTADEQSFYLVFKEKTGIWEYKSSKKISALMWAEKLARENPGEKYYILKATDLIVWKAIRHVELEASVDS